MFRRITVAALAIAAIGAPSALADSDGIRGQYKHLYHQVVKKHGQQTAGRNIAKDGVNKRDKDRPAKKKDFRESIEVLRNILAPPVIVASVATQSAIPSTPAPTTSNYNTASGGPGNATAQCESGGNPKAISPGGKYRGKWQFDQQTWDAYAPSGYKGTDPAAAPESVQDQAAGNVTYDAWPNC